MIRGAGAAALAALALSAGAQAAPLSEQSGLSESELRSVETRVLGADHAAAHARRRELARSGAATATSSSTTALAAVDPEDGGRWSAPFAIPVMGINAVMLPTGKVLWFSYPVNASKEYGDPDAPNVAEAYLWNPATGSFKRVDPPIDPATGKPANIWCAGQTLLPDGRVLVAGGNLAYSTKTTAFAGLDKVYTFNPWNETWTAQPDMAHGRWYPSTATLPDGRVLIVSGLDETGGPTYTPNLDIELFKAPGDLDAVGTVTKLGERGMVAVPDTTPPDGGLYPHLFWMPSGRLLFAGPDPADSWAMHSPGTGNSWPGYDEFAEMSRRRLWGSAVLLPGTSAGSTRVQLLGGSQTDSPTDALEAQPTATTETYDEATNSWTAGASMQVPRSHLNTVLLPDGSMVSIGGGIGTTPERPRNQWVVTGEERAVDIFDPGTGTWRLGAAQAEGRAYHSTALLLPDARVISAGDDLNGGIDRDTAEIYEPPYLFTEDGARAARPRITSAPRTVSRGQPFGVATPDAVAKATLVAPGSTTHANDMNQRVVQLPVAPAVGGVSVTPPSDSDVAPPGWYMLFLLDEDGVPSVARWVLLGDPAPPLGRIELTARVDPAASNTSSARFKFSGAQFDGISLAPGATAARSLPGGPSTAVPGGHYKIQQGLTSGYDFRSVSCDDEDSNTSAPLRLAQVNLAAGETVRCTFVNRKRPAPPPAETPTSPSKPTAGKDLAGPSITVTKLNWRRGVLAGRVKDASGVKRIRAALAIRRRERCRWWSRRKGKLARRATCRRPRWMTAKLRSSGGELRWKLRLRGKLPAGRYLVALTARDRQGNVSRLVGSKAPRVRVRR